jgi:hypothetical protein
MSKLSEKSYAHGKSATPSISPKKPWKFTIKIRGNLWTVLMRPMPRHLAKEGSKAAVLCDVGSHKIYVDPSRQNFVQDLMEEVTRLSFPVECEESISVFNETARKIFCTFHRRYKG